MSNRLAESRVRRARRELICAVAGFLFVQLTLAVLLETVFSYPGVHLFLKGRKEFVTGIL